MAYPTTYQLFDSNNVHVNQALTEFAIAWGSNLPLFVADKIFPEVMVGKDADDYPIFGHEQYVAESDVQGNRDYPREVERGFRTETYKCERHALTEFLADSDLTQADDAIKTAFDQSEIVAFLKEKVLLNREYAVKTLIDTTGSYAAGLYENMDAVGDRNFDDAAGPGAFALIEAYKEAIFAACGAYPDTMTVSGDMWAKLRTDASFFGSATAAFKLSEAELASIFSLDNVFVARAAGSTAKPKSGGAVTKSAIWTSNSLRLTCSRARTKKQPSTGKIFKWNATGGYTNGEMVRTLRDERAGDGGTWFEYKQFFVPKLTGLDASSKIISAALLTNCYDAI